MSKRPLVITTAFSYEPSDLWPLLHSLHQFVPTADVLVLTSEDDLPILAPLKKIFPRLSLETVAHPPQVIHGKFAVPRKLAARTKRWFRRRQQNLLQHPSIAIEEARLLGLSTAQAHFLIRRFFWARERLTQNRWCDHDPVMLCDVRDVVVQGNPFASINNCLITGEEFGLFDHCAMNRRWIRRAYGAEMEQALCGRPALCAGVVMGSREQVILYLDLFCTDALAIMHRHRTSCLENLDQAVHNKILRSPSALQLSISAVNGPIATVGCVPAEDIRVPEGPEPVQILSRVPAVIHQYDRRVELVRHVQSRHGLGSTTDLTP
ncbi:MAG: hypothetical protein WCK64_02880 [Synechococcaceae cyanobacterium ELA445]